MDVSQKKTALRVSNSDASASDQFFNSENSSSHDWSAYSEAESHDSVTHGALPALDRSSSDSLIDSYQFEPKGDELIETVVRLSGVDEKSIRLELETILSASGHLSTREADGVSHSVEKQSDLTIEDLRASMLQYLEEMNRSMTLDSE